MTFRGRWATGEKLNEKAFVQKTDLISFRTMCVVVFPSVGQTCDHQSLGCLGRVVFQIRNRGVLHVEVGGMTCDQMEEVREFEVVSPLFVKDALKHEHPMKWPRAKLCEATETS